MRAALHALALVLVAAGEPPRPVRVAVVSLRPVPSQLVFSGTVQARVDHPPSRWMVKRLLGYDERTGNRTTHYDASNRQTGRSERQGSRVNRYDSSNRTKHDEQDGDRVSSYDASNRSTRSITR